jgi:DNA-binding MarR family transcriptional regulator
MPSESSAAAHLFGDLLALARVGWVKQMAGALATLGYPDYRRSDALVLRVLQRGPMAIGRLAEAIGVSRQGARKVVHGLEQRGLARTARDASDSRQINVLLTDQGRRYAGAVIGVIEQLNRELRSRLDPVDLAAAEKVLREVIAQSALGQSETG